MCTNLHIMHVSQSAKEVRFHMLVQKAYEQTLVEHFYMI